MPSFGGEVKLSVPCRRFVACKRTLRFTWKLESAGKIDQPFLAQFRPSLTEVSHVDWRGVPLEMTDGTKGGAQRTSSLRTRCFREVDPETATHIYLPMYIFHKHYVELNLSNQNIVCYFSLSWWMLHVQIIHSTWFCHPNNLKLRVCITISSLCNVLYFFAIPSLSPNLWFCNKQKTFWPIWTISCSKWSLDPWS
jgi:hypothetical protein